MKQGSPRPRTTNGHSSAAAGAGGGRGTAAPARGTISSNERISLKEVVRHRLIEGMVKAVNGRDEFAFVALICDPEFEKEDQRLGILGRMGANCRGFVRTATIKNSA